MILCQTDRISRHYTGTPIFADLSFQIAAGNRIGLVGPNGAGKTTLLRVLAGQDPPDSGALRMRDDIAVRLLTQFPDFAPEQTVRSEAERALSHLELMHHAMVDAGRRLAAAETDVEKKKWAAEFDRLQEFLRRHGGYDFSHRIEEVLLGLGFTDEEFERPLEKLSGGQQSRVLLAKMLLSSPDLMLLDEPTNHLDIPTTEWLEDYLRRQSAAMVIVSHDRYFLDRVVTEVFELVGGTITEYPGNYQAYLRQRAERQKVAARIGAKQQERMADLADYIERNRAGQLAKQAKSREKMLARLEEERVETIADISGPRIAFGPVTRAGDIVVSAENLTKQYGDNTLFTDLSFQVLRGQRWGIIGPNGAGKTTLVRVLLGEEPPTRGVGRLGHGVKVGYLDQDLALLDADATPLDVVRPPWRITDKPEPFRALLARFGIGADLVENRIGTLSGGECTRVALARLCAYEVNVLVLDEPTNHLDVWACEALEAALKEFAGTVLVASHDRFFLNQIADQLLYIADGQTALIAGNYDRFVEWRASRRAAAATPPAGKPRSASAAVSSIEPRRKRRFPYRKTDALEADIAAAEKAIADLEASLVTRDVYRDGRKSKEVSDQISARRADLERLLAHWEEAMELNG